ncbi:hypothetical protein [Cohnella sp.]|uniref:hypothetical protein n=1 Tax=Cohnella sp. TaxID=1883426 RepID=UPI003569FA43
MSENGKRTYTVPVLLIIIVIMSTLIVILYSKLLISQQLHTTDQGQRLAERYAYAVIFADRLHDGTDGLLIAKSEVERLRAIKLLGEATITSSEMLGMLVEAAHLDSGLEREEAAKPLMLAVNAFMGFEGIITKLAEHEGPLSADESASVTIIRDGAAQMKEALSRFRPPSGEAGFRQMMTIGEWIAPALEATKSLEQIAAGLK